MEDQSNTDTCDYCGKTYHKSELNYGPDPFSLEINDDDTPSCLCDECWQNRKDDI